MPPGGPPEQTSLMSVLKGNNPVHRGRTLRQTNYGRTSTKGNSDVNERLRDHPPFHQTAYGRRPPQLMPDFHARMASLASNVAQNKIALVQAVAKRRA